MSYDNPTLHEAARYGVDDAEKLRELFLNADDLQARDEDENTPLHIAALSGRMDVAKILVGYKVNVDVLNNQGYTPLDSILFQYRRYPTTYTREQIAVALFLLFHGAELDTIWGDRGVTRLYVAAAQTDNSAYIVEQLILLGAKVNLMMPDGETALHGAAAAGNVDAAKLLLDNRAIVDAIAADGTTPLHVAAYCGNPAVAELLIARGADVNAKAKAVSSYHPLAFAYMSSYRGCRRFAGNVSGRRAVAKLILERGGIQHDLYLHERVIRFFRARQLMGGS